jgi:hypothetical protein
MQIAGDLAALLLLHTHHLMDQAMVLGTDLGQIDGESIDLVSDVHELRRPAWHKLDFGIAARQPCDRVAHIGDRRNGAADEKQDQSEQTNPESERRRGDRTDLAPDFSDLVRWVGGDDDVAVIAAVDRRRNDGHARTLLKQILEPGRRTARRVRI